MSLDNYSGNNLERNAKNKHTSLDFEWVNENETNEFFGIDSDPLKSLTEEEQAFYYSIKKDPLKYLTEEEQAFYYSIKKDPLEKADTTEDDLLSGLSYQEKKAYYLDKYNKLLESLSNDDEQKHSR